MNLGSLLAIAVALAMDAFAVAVVTGLADLPLTRRRIFRLAFHFGLFQALMPTLGWAVGRAVHRHVADFDHWIAFTLLALVGGHMIWEALHAGDDERRQAGDATRGWSLVMLSVATSIDALAVGLTLAMIGARILVPALVIGIVAGALTVAGMMLGRWIGTAWGKRVEVLGGFLLIAIGVRIVWEHLSGSAVGALAGP
ncbi:MAG TPA: manganese efflux pump MntP family protein [Anaeromyxobacter sp.]|nr:manganese efflux pump MntP family protein [Anaeromyxobacter sp.]